jgi:two-component system response regulator RegX3
MSTAPQRFGTATGARLLLIDDDDGNREVLAYFLRRQGFVVSTAATGEEGLATIDAQAFDLVLLDLVMPGIGGLATLQAIRSRFPAAVLPVVMVTGLDTADDVEAAVQLGADDYVSKPYQLADALARITALLHRAPDAPIPRS